MVAMVATGANAQKLPLDRRGRDELLARPEARTIVAEFMVRTGLLDQFQAVDPMALGTEEGDEA